MLCQSLKNHVRNTIAVGPDTVSENMRFDLKSSGFDFRGIKSFNLILDFHALYRARLWPSGAEYREGIRSLMFKYSLTNAHTVVSSGCHQPAINFGKHE